MSDLIPPFVPFPKIARYNREVIVTEKIDGTNASIHITDDGLFFIGSRSRWITPETDNFGFARWANEHREELMKLGPGTHFGEWWGAGIQRRYGLTEKRFSLFNVERWSDPAIRPACCSVVPTMIVGAFDDLDVSACINELRERGSMAAPGFMDPEGIVIYHTASGVRFKKTIHGDEKPKSQP